MYFFLFKIQNIEQQYPYSKANGNGVTGTFTTEMNTLSAILKSKLII